MILNEIQKAVLKDYSDGEFAHLIEEFDGVEFFPRENIDGDTFLVFLMVELSDDEDCDNVEEALYRMTVVRKDIDVIIQTLLHLTQEMKDRITGGDS